MGKKRDTAALVAPTALLEEGQCEQRIFKKKTRHTFLSLLSAQRHSGTK